MMCLIMEIAILIFGIVTLVKGELTLSKNKVLAGTPARVVGIVMALMLPALFAVGLFIGVMMAAMLGRQPTQEDLQMLAGLDLLFVLGTVVFVGIMGAVYGKPKSEMAAAAAGPSETPFAAPADPSKRPPGSNPYASPDE